MKSHPMTVSRLVLLVLLQMTHLTIAASADGLALFEKYSAQKDQIALDGFTAAPRNGVVRLVAGGGEKSEMVVAGPQGGWDLSGYAAVVVTAKNASKKPMTLRARVENDGAKVSMDSCRTAAVAMPGGQVELTLRLMRRPEDPGYAVFKPFMMYFKNINVRDNTVDPAAIVRVAVGIDHPEKGQVLELTSIRAVGAGESTPPAFFPFVDEYGQYVHTDWPGKVYVDSDLAQRRDEELQERVDWPGPSDWDKYGGWAKGPRLKATGNFYVTKHDGKWWLVDPEGRLFWSHGPTGVGFGGDVSPVTDRDHWFRNLPARDSDWGQFYRNGKSATYCYYKDREWVGYDVAAANLRRKYGENYVEVVPKLSHDRLRSWGFNTMANWSDGRVYSKRRTPYVVAIHYGSPMIHYRMPDIYHPDWEPAIRKRMEAEKDKTANDPWNIGYFVDNERWWGWRPRGAAIGEETLKNPATCEAKKKFVELLHKRYDRIDRLNDAWKSSFASWEALLESTAAPDMKNEAVLKDCGDFGMTFAERYFSIVRDAVKSVAPNSLYLGVRFHGHVDKEVVKLAGKYCDVISYNIYDNPPDGRINQYRDLDLPIMSTEWGLGSDPVLTPFRGDKLSHEPRERTDAMAKYIEHAIRHPNMVGAHFFQYRDQPLSGRPDGEAVLRGLVSITDTPNFELIQTNRRIAYDLYRTRHEAK